MSIEAFRGRQKISQGAEHFVLRPILHETDIVLKIATPLNYLFMLGADQAEIIRQELVEAQGLVNGTNLKIPRTHIMAGERLSVLGTNTRGYVVGQKYIEEDESVPDIGTFLANEGLTSLIDEYKYEPHNFISNKGVVYWVDPTKGLAGRFLEHMKIMKLEDYRKLRLQMGKIIRY
jgi:hypothetical protein